MREIFFNVSNNIGVIHIFYVLCLLLFNSIAKLLFDNDFTSKTKRLVIVVSIILFIVFWCFGGNFFRLFVCTFFTFGFYDFVGRYIEKWLLSLITFVIEKFNQFLEWFKNLFDFRLFNK